MSIEPSSSQPSSDRPKGPPSGPLAGPSQTDRPVPPEAETRPGGGRSGPPAGPPGGPGGGGRGGDEGPHHPWWKSAPRVAVVATAIVAAVALILVFTRSDDTSNQQRGEVFLQSAGSTGADPFTESTAKESTAPTATPSLPATATATGTGTAVRSVSGDAPGLYGGTRNVASCDVEKQITALKADPSKNAAFASVLGIQPSAVPGYLRTLTPVRLRADTRVTNHGYRNGSATSYQAVLQAGTAVLVDDRGVPRVRCACGNPLTPPAAQQSAAPRPVGQSWSGYRSSHVVVVAPAPRPVKKFVVADQKKGEWFTRKQGDHRGEHDKKTTPPPPPPPPKPSTPSREQTPSNGNTSQGPGNPSKPSESGMPSKPSESGKSSESGKPSKPSESGKPSKPSESGKPSKPSESGKPSKSSESGKPSKPSESGKPSKSSESGK
ncbi:DUF6777 domain-containing protein, partial [Streptomyces sp. NPDC097610]|uniref:DUF6777 domain-containing protein n=1 Tax=Streptomyces sp. NPDC097610 TaxID=3157227 RepID=UPI00332A88AC